MDPPDTKRKPPQSVYNILILNPDTVIEDEPPQANEEQPKKKRVKELGEHTSEMVYHSLILNPETVIELIDADQKLCDAKSTSKGS